jgi:hypothetical protein
LRPIPARVAAVIRVDAAWLATAPLDMRAAGTDSALARVIAVFGAAHPHHAYLFANLYQRGFIDWDWTHREQMAINQELGFVVYVTNLRWLKAC